jgi:hypothetical protein
MSKEVMKVLLMGLIVIAIPTAIITLALTADARERVTTCREYGYSDALWWDGVAYCVKVVEDGEGIVGTRYSVVMERE